MTQKAVAQALPSSALVFLRCWRCNHLLLRHAIEKGEVEIKCPSCKAMTTIRHQGD